MCVCVGGGGLCVYGNMRLVHAMLETSDFLGLGR